LSLGNLASQVGAGDDGNSLRGDVSGFSNHLAHPQSSAELDPFGQTHHDCVLRDAPLTEVAAEGLCGHGEHDEIGPDHGFLRPTDRLQGRR
jgi:hypothetical protein